MHCVIAKCSQFIKQERQDRIATDVAGNVFLGVVRAHLFLVDVLLKDVTEHIGIDLVVGAQGPLVEMPRILFEECKQALEHRVRNLDRIAILLFQLVRREQAAI